MNGAISGGDGVFDSLDSGDGVFDSLESRVCL